MDIQQQIHNYIVNQILYVGDEELNEDLSFQESGILDSIGFLELITFIEENFELKILDNELIPENFDTIKKISRFVQNKIQFNCRDCKTNTYK